jgi:hypothetical protein
VHSGEEEASACIEYSAGLRRARCQNSPFSSTSRVCASIILAIVHASLILSHLKAIPFGRSRNAVAANFSSCIHPCAANILAVMPRRRQRPGNEGFLGQQSGWL